MSTLCLVPGAEEDPEHLLDVDPRSQLDKTIDRIGMGRYQWTLLCLCGFGWMADNMWIQAVAIVLPRVQQHYSVPDHYIGVVSSAMFAGMMIGAVGWGTCSDLLGRSTAFKATPFFTALFGILASFSYDYTSLCFLTFLLGTAVGGSLPTDGTLVTEHMPQDKLHFVTGLSIFLSVGAVVAIVFALLLVPPSSCAVVTTIPCDPALNNGWKYLIGALGVVTLVIFISRILLFRLQESPRFLVHAGRPAEALTALQLIARFNGYSILASELQLADVDDTAAATAGNRAEYQAIWGSDKDYLPHWARRLLDRLQMVLVPEWRRTTILVWSTWCWMAFAFTIFTVFLPKLLEASGTKSLDESLWEVLISRIAGFPGSLLGARLIITPLGRRWSLAGSTLVTAGSCVLFVFAQSAQSSLAIHISTIGFGLASKTMYAILYGWTPEIFATKVRGTACGLASALSRIGGMIAPILGGVLLRFSRAAPVYTSMVAFVVTAGCVLLLREGEGEGGWSGAVRRMRG
ncbi:MFS general substrate transporter [Mycena venus]|uniref:MFS general substrate transporter n=1 Tax=Mycena venus TaxID=2733690 RepID=A0A8H6XER4_9AGAR|nr:MFS general substrate transporter [Mycena venus]